MHSIYTTEGFILKSLNSGEANKYYWIFTKDLGLVRATAQGVRLLKSKLRYHLRDLSLVSLSLVRGRDLWRITNAETISNFGTASVAPLITRIFSLILRLVHGEEKNEELFQTLKEGIVFLINNSEPADKEQIANFECILALRILSNLGYIGKLDNFSVFVESPFFSLELLAKMSTLRRQAISEINKSLKETQL